jgi:ferredoxin
MSVPALVSGFTDLRLIRHDFPLVLSGGAPDAEDGRCVTPLATLIDAALAVLEREPPVDRRLRRDAYRLETRIKELVKARRARSLVTLWRLARRQLLDTTRDEAGREAMAGNLERLQAAMPLDGRVLDCGAGAARAIAESTWRRELRRRTASDREALDGLILRLSQVLDAERAESPRAASPGALSAALGDGHSGGIDPHALSALLRVSRQHRLPEGRSRRLREVLRGLRASRLRLNARPRPAEDWASVAEEWRRESHERAELLRATRMATIELENRYRDDRHAALFAGLEVHQLTPCEGRASRPLLLCLDSEQMGDSDRNSLLEALAGDLPLKVFVAVRRIPDTRASTAAGGSLGEWPARIGELAMSLGNAFVVQAAASQLSQMEPPIEDALAYEGPALVAVYTADAEPATQAATGAGGHAGDLPVYLRCSAAVESRAFPSFVYDPRTGWASGAAISLVGNPQPERAWATHPFAYEDAQSQPAEQELSFTAADFLALDDRFAGHFTPETRSHRRLMTVAEYLAQPAAERSDALPYTHLVDSAGRLRRAIVGWEVISYTNRVARQWRGLQERARPAEQPAAGTETAPEVALQDGSAPSASPVVDEAAVAPAAVAPAAGAPATVASPSGPANGDVAYIESALCTTCDECTGRNPQMFAYNEAKQAFIRDLAAGTYRELVEAAENCPVCIIHPGKPHNPAEPGVDELVERAAAFS